MRFPPSRTQRLAPSASRLGTALALASGVVSLAVARRTRAQRDRAVEDLSSAHTLLRREARLELELRDVAAAAASANISERDLAEMAARHLRDLLNATTAAIRRADPTGLTVVGYSGPTATPTRLGWNERTSAAEAVRTGRIARVEDYGPVTGPAGAFVAANELTCGVSAPIHLSGQLWGSLTATTARPGGFSHEDEQVLDRFARLIAAPLATVRAHEQLRFRARLEGGPP